MSLSSSSVQTQRKRKLSSENCDIGQKRRNPKVNLRLEIPTTTEKSLDDETDVSGADSLFDDIFDELSEVDGSSMTSVNPPSTILSKDSCSSEKLPSSLPDNPLAFRTLSSKTCKPIPGLFFDPSVLVPTEIAAEVLEFCMKTYFSGQNANVNQVMLFERASTTSDEIPSHVNSSSSGLPSQLHTLLASLSTLLLPHLPSAIHSLVFPASSASSSTTSPNLHRARQAIINLYRPGEGITPHVDLLRRFGDGIVGVSFGSGCVMEFRKVRDGEKVPESYATPSTDSKAVDITQQGPETAQEDDGACDLYLPERSVIVMSADARYRWTHGIPRRKWDYVEDLGVGWVEDSANNATDGVSNHGGLGRWLERGTRLSITFRFLLPGAEVVGPSSDDES
ncbi:hypothetical protein VKT23_001470 [Stygiomarasmius scandens]|uniref:Fe2OG dioxygenase domain-containing protein n=1 Tax=Marasmiellus scandens TaxID=2682957 RepID=A0ABR1K1N8_9AGAR